MTCGNVKVAEPHFKTSFLEDTTVYVHQRYGFGGQNTHGLERSSVMDNVEALSVHEIS